ncbi:hypothetical protein ACK33V_13090 [Aeromonas veronii]
MARKAEVTNNNTEDQATEVNDSPQKIKCGLIMPISKSQGLDPDHWLNVKSIICEALADTDFDVRLVSESDDVGVIHKSIVQNIYKNDIVICDVSTHNANVMFELGLRLAFDKPTVIIKDDETPFSFDTQVIEHIVYKRSLHYVDIVSFKKKLKDKVLATLSLSQQPGFSTFLGHFTINHVSKIEEKTVSINDALVERIDQMQKSINDLSRKQNIYNEGALTRDKYDSRKNGQGLTVRDKIRYHLSTLAKTGGVDDAIFSKQIADMSNEQLEEFSLAAIEYVRTLFKANGEISPPPGMIKDEILRLISDNPKF